MSLSAKKFNHKVQAQNNKIPNPKTQISNKSQLPKFKIANSLDH